MTRFEYVAADAAGRALGGTLWARGAADAKRELARRGIIAVRLAPSVPTAVSSPISHKTRLVVLRALATQLGAGVSVGRALAAVEHMSLSRQIAAAIGDARRLVGEGERLAQALNRAALVDSTVAGIIRTGESTGDLGQAINLAVAHMEYEREAFARLRAALTYPAFLLATAVLSFTVIGLFVLPRFAFVVEDFGAEPPALARGLLQLSATFQEHQALIGLLAFAGAGLIAVLLLHERLRSGVLGSLLRLPVVAQLHGLWTSSLAIRSLATMLRSGMPAGRALRTVAESSASGVLRSKLLDAHDMLAAGQPLSRSLAASRIVPERTVPLLEIGERTAQFAEMLTRVAQELERDAAEAFDRALTLLQPTIVLLLGVLIAFVASTVLQTLYSMKPAL